ncbi:MAG: DUF5131 family protein [Burkholderiales bacterium]|nr:DUF5131 family protein [Burkholderiales bacterium]
MSENSKIEWTDHTFNPWEGCQKIGPGCDHCYAEARNARFSGGTPINWGPGAPRRRTSPANWRKPLQWNAAHAEFFAKHGRRQRVFCASLADVFDNAVDQAWRRDLGALCLATPNLDMLLLTKRIGNAKSMLAEMFPGGMPDHVWLGATIVNQEEADRDIPKLLATPARVRFLSMEPLLGPVNLRSIPANLPALDGSVGWDWVDSLAGIGISPEGPDEDEQRPYPTLDWVIVGGESGHGARPMQPDWAWSLRDQCRGTGVPFFMKQMGGTRDKRGLWTDLPTELQCREFPTVF